jgi:hypothetical protein
MIVKATGRGLVWARALRRKLNGGDKKWDGKRPLSSKRQEGKR